MLLKNFTKCCLAIVALAFSAQMTIGATVGYWRFEDGTAGDPVGTNAVLDSSSFGNDGVGAGASDPLSFSGNVPGSVILPGSLANSASLSVPGGSGSNRDRVEVPTSASLETISNGFTVEAFVNGSIDGTDRNGIASKWSTTGGNSFQFRTNPTGQLHLILAHPGGATNSQLVSIASIPDGKWAHVAATWSDTDNTMRVYINGVLDNFGTYGSTSLNTGSDSLWLGAVDGGTDNQFPGFIDEVRISNVALMPSEFLSAVPEPSTLGLAFVAIVGLTIGFRRKK